MPSPAAAVFPRNRSLGFGGFSLFVLVFGSLSLSQSLLSCEAGKPEVSAVGLRMSSWSHLGFGYQPFLVWSGKNEIEFLIKFAGVEHGSLAGQVVDPGTKDGEMRAVEVKG